MRRLMIAAALLAAMGGGAMAQGQHPVGAVGLPTATNERDAAAQMGALMVARIAMALPCIQARDPTSAAEIRGNISRFAAVAAERAQSEPYRGAAARAVQEGEAHGAALLARMAPAAVPAECETRMRDAVAMLGVLSGSQRRR